MEFKDYYKTLGVARDASADDIKRAYRKLARKYHPDVSKESDAEARFKEVGEAYEVLKDPEKRASYDQLRESGWRGGDQFRPPPGWSGEYRGDTGGGGFEDLGGFSDFFESLFGGRARQARSRARRGEDLRARVEVDLVTAHSGGTRRISLERHEPAADGSFRRRRQNLDIRIPAGVTDGQQIRLAGQGEPGLAGGPAGDLYLEVSLLPHPVFEVQGRDVHLVLPVAPWEAALGAKVDVPTLGGRVQMNIPAGSTSGRRLRLKGRGLPGKPPGDQYVILQVAIPPVRDDADRERYERMRREMPFNPREKLEAQT